MNHKRRQRTSTNSENEFLREFPSTRYAPRTVPDRFRRFAARKLLPRLADVVEQGYKQSEKREIAFQILHHLVLNGMVGRVVADSRNTGKAGVRLRLSIWEAIVREGLAVCCVGSQTAGKVARYMATISLLEHFEQWPLQHLVNTKLKKGTAMPNQPTWDSPVLVTEARKDMKKRLLPMKLVHSIYPPVELDGVTFPNGLTLDFTKLVTKIENDLEFINQENLRHTWTVRKWVPSATGDLILRTIAPNVVLQCRYKDLVLSYGRLYTSGEFSAQSFKKSERKRFRIDGERVAELDYKSFHIRRLYHEEWLHADRDAYKPEAILPTAWQNPDVRSLVRGFIKNCTNICISVASRSKAVNAIRNLLFNFDHEDKYSPARRQALLEQLDIEGIDAEGLIDRICEAHHQVAQHFFCRTARVMQADDGLLMLRILRHLTARGIPALGMHDGVLCRRSDEPVVRAAMMMEYQNRFQFPPVVEREF